MNNNLKMINMNDVAVEEISWLWYPYIPYGKITIIQGDPGEGKTTLVLALVALLTTGQPLPGQASLSRQTVAEKPICVIYQTAEDGLGDTIKPRLLALGADCNQVMVIDESEHELTLCDERLERAIAKTGAKLIVLDPLQAYLGSGVDMHRANEIRPIMKQLGLLAERTGCAVIFIGHMNKSSQGKAAYRGLGSIDLRAAARSVLVVGRDSQQPTVRVMAHDKSNIAPIGSSIAFELNPDTGFHWQGCCEMTADELLAGKAVSISKTTQAAELLEKRLKEGAIPSVELEQEAKLLGISHKTLKNAKRKLGVKAKRIGGQWVCFHPSF